MKIEEPEAMRQIREIRNRMCQETEGMTPKQIMEYVRTKADEHRDKSGIKLPKAPTKVK